MTYSHPTSAALIDRFKSRQSLVGIVGLGYVGLPLALRFVEAGFRVLGFDIDERKVSMLNAGESYIDYIGPERIKNARDQQRFEATNAYDRAGEPDALIICVPTPLGIHHEPDLSYIINTVNDLVLRMRSGQLLSLESTTYPGTTDEILGPCLERHGFKIGDDVFLVFSPERVDPGNERFPIERIPKVIGGMTAACSAVGIALYGQIVERTVQVTSPRVAEMAKLLENIYRSVNIGLVNELKIVADRMGINIWEVIDAASTKPFGYTPFYPGPGLGGHCIPIDPFYLTWKAREFGLHTRFIELAGEINTSMPLWVITKVGEALNQKRKSINGSKILILGLAYKKNIDDPRESPAFELLELLADKGADIAYSDPHIPECPSMRRHEFKLKSVDLTPQVISSFDAIVIATDHDAFDFREIAEHSQLIIDTRGRFRTPMPHIVQA